MVARNLEEVIRVFEPRLPLSGEDLEAYYVARDRNPVDYLAKQIQATSGPAKFLLTGTRGSGKSTELNRLRLRLSEHYMVILLTVEGKLDLNDLNHVQVLFTLAQEAWEKAVHAKVKIPDKPVTEMRDLIEIVSKEEEETIGAATEVGAELLTVLLRLTGRLKAEATTRQMLTRLLEPRLSQLISCVDEVVRCIEQRVKLPVLFLVDGLDKPTTHIGLELFSTHGQALFAPKCTMVYTMPVSLLYRSEIAQIRQEAETTFVLPNIRLKDEAGKKIRKGYDILRGLVYRRMERSLVTKNALDLCVENSGGVMRELVRLVQQAAVYAASEGDEKIASAHVARVVEDARNDFRRILTPQHYRELTEFMSRRRFVNTDVALELLYNMALLEYRENGKVIHDLNPLVMPLVEDALMLETFD